MITLFDRAQFGALTLDNRIVMAPLTRLRAGADGIPGDLLVEYYAQRAGFGMILSEGTWPVQQGRSYPGQPGIETAAQVAGWRRVTDAVHAGGGTIVLQLMHGGRVSHPAVSGTAEIVGPSAIAAGGDTHTPTGKEPMPVPHALTDAEVGGVLRGLAASARRAIEAGFDGVEVHGANGYLVHEFLSPASNVRTDRWGGSPEKRARFAIAATEVVAEAIGAERTGIRLSPERGIQGVIEDDPADVRETYLAVAEGLRPIGLAFVDMLHPDPSGDLVQSIRRTAGAPLLVNTGFETVTSREIATALVDDGVADAAVVGRLAIANPDLVERWRVLADHNEPRPHLFYGATAEGYTDYPALARA